MQIFIILLLVLMSTQNAYGFNINHVTYNEGPYRIEYTGILGALIDEYKSQLTRQWRRELNHRYQIGVYSNIELSLKLNESQVIFDICSSGNWWSRNWTESLESAPREKIIISGPKGDIINLGFARITNKWKFKLKEYETDIIGGYTVDKIFTGWKFKFSPTIDVSLRNPYLRLAAFRLRFTWIQSGLQLIKVDINGGYKSRRKECFVEIVVSLVQW